MSEEKLEYPEEESCFITKCTNCKCEISMRISLKNEMPICFKCLDELDEVAYWDLYDKWRSRKQREEA